LSQPLADVYCYYTLQELEVCQDTRIRRQLNKLEVWWVVHLQAYDERYGYVSEAGRCCTRGSRFRDREKKLLRPNSGKYELLPGVDLLDPIDARLLASWVPGS